MDFSLVDLIAAYGPWSWIVGGLVLLAIELVVPGGVFVWLGAAAVVTGLVALVQPMDWPLQWALFGVLGLASIFAWLKFIRNRGEPESDRPLLNQRAARLIGHEVVLVEAISDGFGKVNIGDSVWRVAGPNAAVGRRVRITGADGALLQVELISD